VDSLETGRRRSRIDHHRSCPAGCRKSLAPCLVRPHNTLVTEVPEPRFYGDLASWWPLISPVDEYVEEAALIARLLGSATIPVREVLELGSGGGSNAAHLKQHFSLTLVDLSPEMLKVSQKLNPECVHQEGDMRTVRLGREFDAVFIHDAVGYMTSEEDLTAAARTAFRHCRPGGMALFIPDELRETYEPDTVQGGTDGSDGRGVRYLEWSWDPDPADLTTVTQYVFVLREPGKPVQIVHEEHLFGLFNRQTWVDILTGAGFQVEVTLETTDDDRTPRELFLANRPVTRPDLRT
jgi:trans-aconitate methyltransferase